MQVSCILWAVADCWHWQQQLPLKRHWYQIFRCLPKFSVASCRHLFAVPQGEKSCRCMMVYVIVVFDIFWRLVLQVAHDCDLALLEAILNRHDLYTGQVKGVLHLFFQCFSAIFQGFWLQMCHPWHPDFLWWFVMLVVGPRPSLFWRRTRLHHLGYLSSFISLSYIQ